MIAQGADRVPAVIAEVIDYKVEIFGQEVPERIIQIYRKAVAVTQDKPRPIRISMADAG